MDSLYNPLLFGAMTPKTWFANAMDFAPGLWFDPLLDSGNVFGAMCSEREFSGIDSDCSEVPRISRIEDPRTSFTDVEES